MFSQFLAWRVVLLLPVVTTGCATVDPRIAQVEAGLLPYATERLGATATIEDRMRAYGVPGLSIAVIDQGRIAWAKGYGVADASTGKPVTPTTVFQAASISKPISAFGALLLVRDGVLKLDDSVNTQLVSWKIPDSDLTRDHPVTLRHLLNHTAGLDGCSGQEGREAPAPKSPKTLLSVLRGICVVFRPGERFDYGAAGYVVLQQLISDAARTSFDVYMQQSVLDPLQMNHSRFVQVLPSGLKNQVATGHRDRGHPVPTMLDFDPVMAVGGLLTTPTDIAKYILHLQQAFNGSDRALLDSHRVAEMLRPRLEGGELGPQLSGSGSATRFGHDGGQPGFEATFTAYLHDGRGIVAMANAEYSFMLILEVLESVRRVYGWPEFGETTQRPPAASMGQQLVVPISSKNLVGAPVQFTLSDGVTFKVRSGGTRLYIDGPGFGTAEIFETPDGRLFCPPLTFSDLGSPWLRLIFDQDGNLTKMLADDDGGVVLPRID
ncbi:MAG: beta-lactamase family protein [Hyphomonas sp.]|jgi:CubicO group peptidase (beta-lactamase class C family)|nr:beta-lactamase family protein [Hyphomonas sp.]